MKITSQICGEGIILVPYLPIHVEKYHEWMKNEVLLEKTASEPLTLDQEYEMQKSWENDADKCTFIILDKQIMHETQNQVAAMIGDTNVFLYKDDEDENGENDENFDGQTGNLYYGEIEIMIAEENARRKGFALEALKLMINYCQKYLKIFKFIAKIGEDNAPSISLFTRKLGFTEISRSNAFKEISFELRLKC